MVTQATKVDVARRILSPRQRANLAKQIEVKRAAVHALLCELDDLTSQFIKAELAAHQHVTPGDIFRANRCR